MCPGLVPGHNSAQYLIFGAKPRQQQHGAQFNIPLYRSKGFTAFEEEIE